MTVIRLSARVPGAGRQEMPAVEVGDGGIPSSGARALALAFYIDDLLECGRVASAAEVAGALGVTRARVSQVMALLGLSAGLQERLLMGEFAMSGRGLRLLLGRPSWPDQWEYHLEVPGRRGP